MIAKVLALTLLLQDPRGAVSGQLRTIDGVPAVNVRVVMIPAPTGSNTVDDGLNYFEPYFELPADHTLTDNDGNFRLQEIVPGRYFLLAGAPGQGQGTYYPDSPHMKGAEVITVQAGLEIDHLDFQLRVQLGGKVTGKVNASMASLGPRTATITGGTLEYLLEVPVRADGTFTFGHVSPGKYLLSLYPPTPGIASMPITVKNEDVSDAELVPLPTKNVTGRIVVKNGSIPYGLLGFYTGKTWVTAKISEKGTFSVALHSARHQIDFAGLPAGYTVASVKVDNEDVTSAGILVGDFDVSNVVITLNAPKHLAVVEGKISGLDRDRFASTAVVLTGPTFNRSQADIEPDGSFRFDAVVPGVYRLTLNDVPKLAPITVVVDGFGTYEVPVAVNNP
jgi:hypothetical protein